MATLENLSFEVILRSEKFEQDLKRIQNLANTFNTSMSNAFVISGISNLVPEINTLKAALREATEAQKALNEQVKKMPGKKIVVDQTKEISALNGKLQNTATMLRTLSVLTGGAFSVYGIRRFLTTLVKVTGEFEVQKMALRTMLKDIDAADKIFQDLYRFSSDSTYRFSELAKHAKQLAAFNIGKSDLLETTKMLGDVASGVGVSMDRIILAYGHVKSSGFLRGIQLRSFSQNGVPVLDELAKMFSELENRVVSLGEVFDKMTKREIPFEMVEEAFRRMTSEGGKFYKMQEVLSKTLAGQINILKGRWENLMYAIGQSQDSLLKGAVGKVSELIANYDKFGEAIKQVVAALGAYKLTMLSVELATNTFSLANHRLLKALARISTWAISNPFALIAGSIAAISVVMLRVKDDISDTKKITNALENATIRYNESLSTELGELDALYGRLKSAREGTEEYNSAKLAMESRFAPYIAELRDEGVAVADLAILYQNLADKIKNATKQRFLEESQQDIIKAYKSAADNSEARLKAVLSQIKSTSGRGLTADEEGAIRHYVNTGEKNALFKSIEGSLNNRMMVATAGQHGVEYKRVGKTFRDELTEIKNDIDLASITYADAMSDASKRFDAVNSDIVKKGDENVYKLSSIVEGIKKLDSEIAKIRSKAQRGSITESEKTELEELVKDREEQARLYKSIMGVDYDKSINAQEKAIDKAIDEKISRLSKEASVVKKYKEVYDSLRPYLGDENMASAMESLFGFGFDNLDFDNQLDRIIVSLSELGEKGQEAAESLRASLGKSTAQELKKALEAQDKAAEMLSTYLEKEFGIEGEGVAAKISKVLVDLTNKNLKADKDLEKFVEELDKTEIAKKLEILSKNSPEFTALRGVLGEKETEKIVDAYWIRWRKQQIDAWKERMKLEKEANKKLSNEKIVEYADDYFKFFTGGLDLTNFNDKTIAQLQTIRSELLKMTIPTSIVDLLDDDTLERFSAVLGKMQEDALDKIDLVLSEKKVGTVKRIATEIGNLGSSIVEIGDAMNNQILSGVGKTLLLAQEIGSVIIENTALMAQLFDKTGKLVTNMDELTKSTDWITMVAKLALIFIKNVISAAAEAEARMKALQDAALEARSVMYENELASSESIFGTNFIQQIATAKSQIDALNKSMARTIATYQMPGSGNMGNLFTSAVEGITQGNSKLDSVANTKLTAKTGWFGKYSFTLSQMASSLGYELFDSFGNVNLKLIEAIENTFKLTDVSKQWLDELKQDTEDYAKAVETVQSAMNSIFGNIASAAADTIVAQWIEAGSAALDYADILDDVAKSYAKMLIQSTILGNIFSEDEINRLASLFMNNEYQAAMKAVEDDMSKITELEPVFKAIMEAFEPYFNRSDSSDNTLANGIKGITEDTANLLASYINAIRADVSVMRLLAERGWSHVENIANAIAYFPTLADHVAQMAANSANIDTATQQILQELRGVIINEGAGRGFRAYVS